MDEQGWLAERFEEQRGRLRAVAYRMLGSLSEADDAVQETWLRASRADTSAVDNLGGWLTTITARVCLNMLRAGVARRAEPLDPYTPEPVIDPASGASPEHEVLLADAVGLALLVVLQSLNPAERLAFVLHDMFDLPFDEIAPIVERTPEATRQLASRARRRVRGGGAPAPDGDPVAARIAVDAFLAAARQGDLAALIAVLHPDVLHRTHRGAAGGTTQLRGAATVARQAVAFSQAGLVVVPVLINGAPGIVSLRDGQPFSVLAFTVIDGSIAEIDALLDPGRLAQLDLSAVDG